MDNKFFHIHFGLSIFYADIIVNVLALFGKDARQLFANELPPIICIAKYNPNIYTDEGLLCSGTLVTQDLVVTGAHCFATVDDDDKIEMIISNDLKYPGTIYYAVWWITFLQYMQQNNMEYFQGTHDIAVIKIFGLLSHIVPAVISPYSPTQSILHLTAQINGCGRSTISQTPMFAKTGFVHLVNNEDCIHRLKSTYGESVRIPQRLLCSYNIPHLVLEPGDSGGPVFICGFLVAINVATCPNIPDVKLVNKLNVHLDIDLYRDFIHQYMNFE